MKVWVYEGMNSAQLGLREEYAGLNQRIDQLRQQRNTNISSSPVSH